ncbi:diguanylate cyclase domain-containing protein [Actinoplanes subglobosus]|uniref:Diguanylate cyclase domain-containing protein n=1 Tax=Actinoplanes subglobosus TaxID=1547892 RepID=A0ABV8IKH6_9ACTN
MQRVGVWVAGAIVAGSAVQGLAPLLEPRAAVVSDNILLAVIAFVTTLGHVRQARLSRGRRRVVWSLAAFSAGFWALSSVIDTVDVFMATEAVLDEGLAVGAAICSLAALVALDAVGRAGLAGWLPRLLDVATVAGALFFLAWEFVLGPAYARLPGGSGPLVVLVVLPELIGAAYAVVLLSRSLSDRGDVALSLLASALMTFAVTMLLAVHNFAQGLPWYATGVGAGYVVAGLLTALASRAPLPSETFTDQSRQNGRWTLLPYLPVGLAFGAAAWRFVRTGNVTAVLFWLLLATASLVLARQFLNLRVNQRLADDLRRQRAELAYQASHDSLTGLANRAGFQHRAQTALAEAGPDGLTGVLLIDLDGFKAVNDTYGHSTGDALLVGVAARLRAGMRGDDTVARLGGDEFVVLLPHLAHPDEARDIGVRVLELLAEPIDVGAVVGTARGSVGATVGVGARYQPLELVEQADVALYEAKAAGKGVVRGYATADESLRNGTEPATGEAASRGETDHRQPGEDRRRVRAAP